MPGVLTYSTVQPTPIYPAPPEEPRYIFIGHLVGDSNIERQRATSDVLFDVFSFLVGLVKGDDRSKHLSRPQGGWVDSKSGRIFVTDSGRKAVFIFDEHKGEFGLWDDAGGGQGFITPVGIIGLDNDEYWVADADLKQVVRLNTRGEFIGVVADAFSRPTGLAYDATTRRIFVADSAAHTIKYFDVQGQKLGEFGARGDAAGEFNSPTHLAFHDGELYVSDTLNARIQVFSVDGKYRRQFGRRGVYMGDLPRPKGVAVDEMGRVYVVESYYDYLLVYDRDGRPLIPISGANYRAVAFDLPAGVWLDANNRVYVADMLNSRVAVFQYVGPDGSTASKMIKE